MPEVMEGHWLWSLGSHKGLLTVGEGDLAGVHVGHLRAEMRRELLENRVTVKWVGEPN